MKKGIGVIPLLLTAVFMPAAAFAETATVAYQNTVYLQADFGDPLDLDVDPNGNYYHAGSFYHASPLNFNPDGSDLRSSTVNQNGYFTKYNSNGTYAWTRTIAGASQDYVEGVTADSAGNVYAVGTFQGANVNFNEAGSELRTSAGSLDAFITKYSPSGTHLWTITNGSASWDSIDDVEVDSSSDIIIKGSFTGTLDFDPGAGTDNHTSTAPSGDVYISKFTKNGVYQWTKFIKGDGAIDGEIELDASDNIYIAGYFNGTTDFDVGAGTNNVTPSGLDSYLLKLSPSGANDWLKIITGVGSPYVNGLAVRGSSILVGGEFTGGSVNFNSDGSDIKTLNGSYNAFMNVWTTDGTYGWTNTWGNDEADVQDVSIDKYGDFYAIGNYTGTNVNFNPAGSALHSTQPLDRDIFIVKYTGTGDYQWSKATFNGVNFATGIGVTDNLDVLSFGQLFASDASGTNLNPDGSAYYNDTTTFDIYLTRWSQTVTQSVSNIPANIVLKDTAGNPVSTFTQGQQINVKLADSTSGDPIVAVPLNLTSDVDWSSVTVGTDPVSGKAFVHGLGAATGTSGNHTLYIPKLADQNAVIICPDATSLAEVTPTCSNKQELTEASPNVTIETIGGKQYWVVTGLSGTGGLGTVLAANTLVNAGGNVSLGTILGIILVTTPILLRKKYAPYRLRVR